MSCVCSDHFVKLAFFGFCLRNVSLSLTDVKYTAVLLCNTEGGLFGVCTSRSEQLCECVRGVYTSDLGHLLLSFHWAYVTPRIRHPTTLEVQELNWTSCEQRTSSSYAYVRCGNVLES